ncbi:MAG: L,D-transpeptidase [Actinobacteria bacterium]|nr:L,D-transpeptidase [Actinomycetota bacterium]
MKQQTPDPSAGTAMKEDAEDDQLGRRRPRWPLWTGAGVLGVVLAGTGASLAFANTIPNDTISLGTSVSGVDIGGMSLEQATSVLAQADPKSPKVKVKWSEQTYTFDPAKAGIGIDPAASAQAAYDASLGENPFKRTIDMYLGHEVAPVLQQDRSGIDTFVSSLPQDVSGVPVSATVSGIPGEKLTVSKSEAQTGLDVDRLRADLDRAVTDGEHGVKVQGHRHVLVEPAVTTDQLKEAVHGSAFLYVDQRAEGPLEHQSVSLYREGRFVRSYPVSTGQAAWPTNVGLTAIESHIECPAWVQGSSGWFPNAGSSVPGCAPGNPLGRYWLGIGDGEGFHVGSVYVLSHGCIHMNEPDIKALYDELPNGTPVYVGPL